MRQAKKTMSSQKFSTRKKTNEKIVISHLIKKMVFNEPILNFKSRTIENQIIEQVKQFQERRINNMET